MFISVYPPFAHQSSAQYSHLFIYLTIISPASSARRTHLLRLVYCIILQDNRKCILFRTIYRIRTCFNFHSEALYCTYYFGNLTFSVIKYLKSLLLVFSQILLASMAITLTAFYTVLLAYTDCYRCRRARLAQLPFRCCCVSE